MRCHYESVKTLKRAQAGGSPIQVTQEQTWADSHGVKCKGFVL